MSFSGQMFYPRQHVGGLMRRDSRFRFPETGPNAQRGEDSVLLDSLYQRLKVTGLSDSGHLYLYTYHGRNTFPEEHHRRLETLSAPAAFLHARGQALRDSLLFYSLPRPFSIRGQGNELYSVEG